MPHAACPLMDVRGIDTLFSHSGHYGHNVGESPVYYPISAISGVSVPGIRHKRQSSRSRWLPAIERASATDSRLLPVAPTGMASTVINAIMASYG